jgi:hypothetical protein
MQSESESGFELAKSLSNVRGGTEINMLRENLWTPICSCSTLARPTQKVLGEQYLTGDKPRVIWAEFSNLS